MEAVALIYSILLIVTILIIVFAVAVKTKLNELEYRLKQLEAKHKPKKWATK